MNDGAVDGSIPFPDSRIKAAWEKFGQIALTDGYVVQGGAAAGENALFWFLANAVPCAIGTIPAAIAAAASSSVRSSA